MQTDAPTQAPSHSTMVTVLSLALQALSAKLVVMVAMVMAFSLFVVAVCVRDWLALGAAASFAVLVFLPVFLKSKATASPE
jgi:hypothetical protein